MNGAAAQILDRGARALLVVRAHPGARPAPPPPLVTPMDYWFDGRAAWMTTVADSARTAALSRDPSCALYLSPKEDGSHRGTHLGVVAEGRARVFSLRDPLGLTLHAPTIAVAMAALAARNAGSMARGVQGTLPVPGRLIPQNRVVLRVVVEALHEVPLLRPQAGIAPALPSMVPSDIRRIIAGRRQVLVAADTGTRLVVATATWGTGFSLGMTEGDRLPAGVPATAAVDVSGANGVGVGLAVHGMVTDRLALEPQHVTWWRGATIQSAQMPPPGVRAGAVTLPD